MAIAAVAATHLSGGGSTASGAVSATAGNSLIVGGSMWNTSSWGVSRTGDTYTTDTNGANSAGTGIASAPNVAGGSVTMTVTCTSGGGISAWAAEMSGLPTSAIRDATSPAVGTGTSTSAATGSLANVTADAVYFISLGDSDGGNPTTITTPGGWTDAIGGVTMKELNGATGMAGALAFQIVSTIASRSATWTISSSLWCAGIAVYKAAAGAATSLVMPHNPLAAMIGR